MITPLLYDSFEYMEFDDFSRFPVKPNTKIHLSRNLISHIYCGINSCATGGGESHICVQEGISIDFLGWNRLTEWSRLHNTNSTTLCMTFCFIQISPGIKAVTAESDETVEHFQIISFEDHNKCAAGTTEKIVGALVLREQRESFSKTPEGHRATQKSLRKSEVCAHFLWKLISCVRIANNDIQFNFK